MAGPQSVRYMLATDRALRPKDLGTARLEAQAPTRGVAAVTGAAVAAMAATGTVVAEAPYLPLTRAGAVHRGRRIVGAVLAASLGRKALSSRVPTTTRAFDDA